MTARALSIVATLAAVATVAGCAAPLTVEAAPHAHHPDCAVVMLAAPPTLGGLELRATTAQAAEAWGDSFPIGVRCGVEVPPPTTDPCVTVEVAGGTLDWVVRDAGDAWVATTYGRDPAVEAVVPKERADEAVSDVLAEITPFAALAPRNGRQCY